MNNFSFNTGAQIAQEIRDNSAVYPFSITTEQFVAAMQSPVQLTGWPAEMGAQITTVGLTLIQEADPEQGITEDSVMGVVPLAPESSLVADPETGAPVNKIVWKGGLGMQEGGTELEYKIAIDGGYLSVETSFGPDAANVPEWEANQSYFMNQCVKHENVVYMALSNVTDAVWTPSHWSDPMLSPYNVSAPASLNLILYMAPKVSYAYQHLYELLESARLWFTNDNAKGQQFYTGYNVDHHVYTVVATESNNRRFTFWGGDFGNAIYDSTSQTWQIETIKSLSGLGYAKYNQAQAYAVGDIVAKAGGYRDGLYRCKAAVAANEAWDDQKWDEITTAGQIAELVSDMSSVAALAEGRTKSYVVNALTDITYSSESADGDLLGVTAITGATLSEMKVGDVVYIKDVNVPDYWVSAVASGSLTLSKMETKLTGYVTGTGLTADKILLGDGSSAVKTSSKGISTAKPASADDNNVPTVGAVYAGLQDKIDKSHFAEIYYDTNDGSWFQNIPLSENQLGEYADNDVRNILITQNDDQTGTNTIVFTGGLIGDANANYDPSFFAYFGDRFYKLVTEGNVSNIVEIPITKAQVGLGNVDNTSDANKPISTATQTALNKKLGRLVVDGTLPDSSMPVAISLTDDQINAIRSGQVDQILIYNDGSSVSYPFDKMFVNDGEGDYYFYCHLHFGSSSDNRYYAMLEGTSFNIYKVESAHDAAKEDVANKTTSLSGSSTDTQYPSAKATYDADLVAKYHLGAFDTVSGNVVTRQTGYLNPLNNTIEDDADYGTHHRFAIIVPDLYAANYSDPKWNAAQDNDPVADASVNKTGIQGYSNHRIYVVVKDLTTVAQLRQWFQANSIQIQYKLTNAYTEIMTSDLPLDTLDQMGSQFVRKEWENGLNLVDISSYEVSPNGNSPVTFNNGTIVFTSSIAAYAYAQIYYDNALEVGKKYTLSLMAYGNGSYNKILVKTSHTSIDTDVICTFDVPSNTHTLFTFTFVATTTMLVLGAYINANHAESGITMNVYDVMLNEGDHAYPYQPYAGPIVHKKELDEVDGKTVKMISVTWAELKALRDGGNLVPGMQYRITDYTCTTTAANTTSAGHVFDVIVTADSISVLNENARAIQHAGDTYFANSDLTAWELKYCIDNDTARFAWADSANGKGVIYRLIDEFGNDVPYDFKNIIFEYKKYLIAGTWVTNDYTYVRNSSLDAGGYYGWSVVGSVSYGAPTELYTDTENPSTTSQLFSDTSGSALSETIKSVSLSEFTSYTFNLVVSSNNTDASLQGLSKECHSNIIGVYVLNGVQTLNKTVFRLSADSQGRVYCYANVISPQNRDNLFTGRDFYGNSIGSNFYSNTIGFGFSNNSIDSDFYSNTIGSDFSGNTIGSDCSDNTIGSSFYYNTVGVKFKSNITDGEFFCNTIGPNCSSNTIGSGRFSSVSSNTIGPNCSSNTIGADFKSNIIGADFKSNTIGSRFQYNIIGSDCSSNTIGSRVQYSTIGSYFRNNAIGASASDNVWARYCKFDDGVQYISLTSDDTSASSSNQIQNVHIHAGVKGISTSNRKIISVPDRNLAYETDVYQDENGEITYKKNNDEEECSYSETMEILSSVLMPEGTTVSNNNVTLPEGSTVANHNVNL